MNLMSHILKSWIRKTLLVLSVVLAGMLGLAFASSALIAPRGKFKRGECVAASADSSILKIHSSIKDYSFEIPKDGEFPGFERRSGTLMTVQPGKTFGASLNQIDRVKLFSAQTFDAVI